MDDLAKLDRPGAPVRRWDLPQAVGGPCRWAGCDTPSSTTEQVAGEVMALCAPHAERERAWKMKENADLKRILDQSENGRRVQGQSLGDRVRSEFAERWGWLLDLTRVGA